MYVLIVKVTGSEMVLLVQRIPKLFSYESKVYYFYCAD